MDIESLKSFFVKYLLLLVIILIFAVVLIFLKKRLPKVKVKVLILYLLVAGICLAIPGFLGFTGNTFNPFWYILSMIVYTSLGALNVNLLDKYFHDPSVSQGYTILFESLITITSMLLGGYLFYWIFNWMSPYEGYAIMATTSISIYIVPLAFYYCYLQFINIPFDIYKTWQPPTQSEAVDFDKIKFDHLLVLNLELTKGIEDGQRTSINAKAPSDGVSFGQWFYRAVDDYNFKYPNATIRLFDPQNELYSWIFYTKKSVLHLRKFIDFDKTITENNITDHTTIICKRVKQTETIEYRDSY